MYNDKGHRLRVNMKNKNVLQLVDLFKHLEGYNYALIKTEASYMSEDFPRTYPIGKDLDIVSTRADFNDVNDVLISFAKGYKRQFRLKLVKGSDFYRIRMIKLFNLHYQLDNSFKLEFDNSEDFIEKAIKNRKQKEGYFILETKYELIIRMYEAIKNPQKFHHKDFIVKNIEYIDPTLFPSQEFNELYNKINQIIA